MNIIRKLLGQYRIYVRFAYPLEIFTHNSSTQGFKQFFRRHAIPSDDHRLAELEQIRPGVDARRVAVAPVEGVLDDLVQLGQRHAASDDELAVDEGVHTLQLDT